MCFIANYWKWDGLFFLSPNNDGFVILNVPYGGRLCLEQGTWSTNYWKTRQLMVRVFMQWNLLKFYEKNVGY